MIKAENVSEILYDFNQRCFIGESAESTLDMTAESSLFEFLSIGPITVVDIHRLAKQKRALFRELITQYIIFLEMNKQLNFPPFFLEGSSKEGLGVHFLQYICKHRWPFPQLLKKLKTHQS